MTPTSPVAHLLPADNFHILLNYLPFKKAKKYLRKGAKVDQVKHMLLKPHSAIYHHHIKK